MRANRHKITKYCAYALLLILCFALQNARGVLPSLWGAKTDVMPFIVAAIALYDGPFAAGSYGFAAGILTSVHSPVIEGLSALYLLLFGVAFGVFGQLYIRKIAPAALLGGAACIAVQSVARYIFYYRLVYSVTLDYAVLLLVGELTLSILPGIVMYYVIRGVHRRFAEADTL